MANRQSKLATECTARSIGTSSTYRRSQNLPAIARVLRLGARFAVLEKTDLVALFAMVAAVGLVVYPRDAVFVAFAHLLAQRWIIVGHLAIGDVASRIVRAVLSTSIRTRSPSAQTQNRNHAQQPKQGH